jgi:hypothetical protein
MFKATQQMSSAATILLAAPHFGISSVNLLPLTKDSDLSHEIFRCECGTLHYRRFDASNCTTFSGKVAKTRKKYKNLLQKLYRLPYSKKTFLIYCGYKQAKHTVFVLSYGWRFDL